MQEQILLGNKNNRNGVNVTGNFGGGISLGLLRPYYLEITDNTAGNRRSIKYESADSISFVSPTILNSQFASGPGLGKGWSDLKVVPGAYGKLSLRFDYGRYNEVVNALDVGITGEIYSKEIPQLIYTKPKQFFFSAYFAILFGKRK